MWWIAQSFLYENEKVDRTTVRVVWITGLQGARKPGETTRTHPSRLSVCSTS